MTMWEKKRTASDSITNNRIGLRGVWGGKVGYGRDPPGPELEVAGIKPPPATGNHVSSRNRRDVVLGTRQVMAGRRRGEMTWSMLDQVPETSLYLG